MTSAKQTKQSNQKERVSYLVSLIDAATLRRFTQKRATKLASIVLWGDETIFKRLVDASKSGIAYADRFIAIAGFLAAAGLKETKDLWGKSDYSCRRYANLRPNTHRHDLPKPKPSSHGVGSSIRWRQRYAGASYFGWQEGRAADFLTTLWPGRSPQKPPLLQE